MVRVIWTALAVVAMAGMFSACVIVVAAGIRVLESALAKRRGQPPA
jgi:hypothetical protein